jgi:hypothetical protein
MLKIKSIYGLFTPSCFFYCVSAGMNPAWPGNKKAQLPDADALRIGINQFVNA